MDTTQGHDYRIFVGAFPMGELGRRIQAVRQTHDPKTARITPPHVTMAGTYWRSGPATPANEAASIDRLDAVRSRIEPFELILGGIQSFMPVNTVIYLGVEATAGLLAARRVLLEALGQDKHRQFAPHLTLAMRLDRPAAEALLAELQRSEWHRGRWVVPVDELRLMQRGPQDPAWRTIHTVRL